MAGTSYLSNMVPVPTDGPRCCNVGRAYGKVRSGKDCVSKQFGKNFPVIPWAFFFVDLLFG